MIIGLNIAPFYGAMLCMAPLCYGKSSVRPSECMYVYLSIVGISWSYSFEFKKIITLKLDKVTKPNYKTTHFVISAIVH